MSVTDTEQAVTETTPVIEDEKPKTVPYERLSEMAAQKNAAIEEARLNKEELVKIKGDQKKVRDAQLAKNGEYKTLLEEKEAELATMSTNLTAVQTKWDNHEAKRREAINSIEGLTDEDKKIADGLGLDAAEVFVNRITAQPNSTSTDTRRTTNQVANGKLKPLADMTDKEKNDTHEARIKQYVK